MQRKTTSALIVSILILSSIPAIFFILPMDDVQQTRDRSIPLDFNALAEVYGDQIPVVVRMDQGVSASTMDIILSLDLEFSLGSADNSHIGPYYLLQGPASGLQVLTDLGLVSDIASQTHAQFLESPRDLSIPEINADDVWMMLDDLSVNVTGEGILIADLDSGVDWRHPDLWFADGGSYPYVNSSSSGFINGTDAVDFNRDFALSANESLYALDLADDGFFNTTTDWLWVDNLIQNAFPDDGELFFVVNDTSSNGLIDGGEDLILLGTPKTKFIVEKNASVIQIWERGVNMTSSTHVDTDGHGTAVAGILLGGQLGYRDYVGVAPSAELMMIRVLGTSSNWLTVEEGLTYASNNGADVVLTEIGSWTYHFLDGSSLAEQMIDTLVASGIPVISPSGNLGGKDKHSMFSPTPDVPLLVDFSIPQLTDEISEVYITVLSADSIDFTTCNFSLVIDRTAFAQGPITVYLHPGIGYYAWFAEPPVPPSNFIIESFIAVSTRGTNMLAIWIHGTLPTTLTAVPPWHSLNVTAPSSATFHGYISDDQTAWTGGAVWTSSISDLYHITWPSTADSALSVASYRTRDLVSPETIGGRASFSSNGPRIDSVAKQGVAAPGGYDVISDYSNASTWSTWYNGYGALPFLEGFGSYRLFSGTSASGPHVAGAAALMLQVNSTIGTQVKTIIESTALTDSFTGATPNSQWGHGKLDVAAAVLFLMEDTTPPTIDVPTRIPFTPTSTQTVDVNVTVTDNVAVDTVILSYNAGVLWVNVSTLALNATLYNGMIPTFSNGTVVMYRFYANDTSDNWAVSGIYSYTVSDMSTTTTTTTGTGTTTTSTGPTNTTTPTTPQSPDYLRIAILLSVVLLVVIYNRRRSS
ncbi:MAG: S8 family serine peptidase [Candidatus Thorarchaeota archaeon]